MPVPQQQIQFQILLQKTLGFCSNCFNVIMVEFFFLKVIVIVNFISGSPEQRLRQKSTLPNQKTKTVTK